MKYILNRKLNLSYHYGDGKAVLGIVGVFNMSQDMITKFFNLVDSDNITVKEKNNALWVFSKCHFRFLKYPHWEETELNLKTFFTDISSIKTVAETTCCDDNNELVFIGITEGCVIDINTRNIRRISTISFKDDAEPSESSYPLTFNNLNKITFQESDYVKDVKVEYTDTDFSAHTNNVSYVRYCINTFSRDYYMEKDIEDFEIHFKHESHWGETLKIYRKTEGNNVFFLIKKDEIEIIRASMIIK